MNGGSNFLRTTLCLALGALVASGCASSRSAPQTPAPLPSVESAPEVLPEPRDDAERDGDALPADDPSRHAA